MITDQVVHAEISHFVDRMPGIARVAVANGPCLRTNVPLLARNRDPATRCPVVIAHIPGMPGPGAPRLLRLSRLLEARDAFCHSVIVSSAGGCIGDDT